MKLKKLKDYNYVVVTDEPIKEGDWHINFSTNEIETASKNLSINWADNWGGIRKQYKKITHSTQPLNKEFNDWFDVKILDLSYIKSLVGEVDVEKLAEEMYQLLDTEFDTTGAIEEFNSELLVNRRIYKAGYNKCLEDNKDKRFSEEDMRKAIFMAREDEHKIDVRHPNEIISSITQPKDTWEVYFDSDNNLKLK